MSGTIPCGIAPFSNLNLDGLRPHADYEQQDRNQKERSVDIDVASP